MLPDADVDFAADHLAAAAFGSAGERCMAISVAVAVGGAGDAVVEAVNERARDVKVGNGRDDDSEMGPVVTRQAQERIVGLVDAGEQQGATVTVDGRGYVVPGLEDGFFVGPTVLDRVSTEMDVYPEEIFGPVLSVVRVETVDEAIALVNANPYGNGTAIFTSSGEAARRFQRGVNVGMIGINVPVPVPMAYYSFGGWKDSLFGDKHVHGPEGVSFYTRAKVVTARWPRQRARQRRAASTSRPRSSRDRDARRARPAGFVDVTTGLVLEDRRVVVDGERVTAVLAPGDGPPVGSEVLDLGDCTVLPGLIDLHTHLVGPPEDGDLAAVLDRSPAVGGTGRGGQRARDAGGRVHLGPRRRQLLGLRRRRAARAIDAGLVEGPRMSLRGRLPHLPGRWRRGRPACPRGAPCRRSCASGWSTPSRTYDEPPSGSSRAVPTCSR